MRTTRILAVLLVALWAVPALGASGTWTNATENGDWSNAGNWSGVAAPGNGETATFDGSEGALGLPDGTDNEPSAVKEISISIGGTATYTTNIVTDLFNSKGATIGAVTINNANATITPGGNIAGAITITDGTLAIAAARTLGSTVAVATAGYLNLDASDTVTASGTITMAGSSTLDVNVGTTLDIAAAKSLTGTADQIMNAGIIQGVVNMTAVTTWGGNGTITVNEDGTVNLGTDADNNQIVDIAADVTLGDSFRCHALDGSSGVITGAGKTITVGSGGLDWGAAEPNGSLLVTMAEDAALCKTAAAYANRLHTLTITGDVTNAGPIQTEYFAGAGAFDLTVGTMALRNARDNSWTYTGAITGDQIVAINCYATVDTSIAADIVLGGTVSLASAPSTNDVTLTLNGKIEVGGDLFIHSETDNQYAEVVFAGGLEVAGTTLLGRATTPLVIGKLTMTAGQDHVFTGTIARWAGTGHAITFAGEVSLGGNVTLIGIAPDFGSAVIEASAAITIDGTTAGTVSNTDGTIFANDNVVTVTAIDYATTTAPIICVSCVDGTGSGAGVEFQEPARTLMGVGF